MTKAKNLDEIRKVARKFTQEKEPVEREIVVHEGVIFHFDNPFEEDVEENMVPATLMIDKEVYPDYEPDGNSLGHDLFEDVSDDVRTALEEGGFTSVRAPEYDKANSTEGLEMFAYSLET